MTPRKDDEPAIGLLADYREELALALERVKAMTLDDSWANPVVYQHTLIDSVVYPAVRLHNMVVTGSVSDLEVTRWNLVLAMNIQIMLDTLRPHPVVFLRGGDAIIEEAIDAVLAQWEIPFTELTSVEDAATLIQSIISEDDDNEATEAAGIDTSGEDASSSIHQDD